MGHYNSELHGYILTKKIWWLIYTFTLTPKEYFEKNLIFEHACHFCSKQAIQKQWSLVCLIKSIPDWKTNPIELYYVAHSILPVMVSHIQSKNWLRQLYIRILKLYNLALGKIRKKRGKIGQCDMNMISIKKLFFQTYLNNFQRAIRVTKIY